MGSSELLFMPRNPAKAVRVLIKAPREAVSLRSRRSREGARSCWFGPWHDPLMSSTADDRWYAFVRFAGEEHEREGYVFASYEQALEWRERTESGRSDIVASGLIPESVREHTRQLAREHRAAEEATDA